MSTRYEDAQNDRSRSRRDSRDLDDGSAGVRQASDNIRNAGGDIVGNICGIWGNLLNSVSDVVSPRTSSNRPSNNPSSGSSADNRGSGLFDCDGGQFKVSCGPAGGRRSEGDSGDSRADKSSIEVEASAS